MVIIISIRSLIIINNGGQKAVRCLGSPDSSLPFPSQLSTTSNSMRRWHGNRREKANYSIAIWEAGEDKLDQKSLGPPGGAKNPFLEKIFCSGTS